MEKVKWGYCAVTADIIHKGHIALFKQCAERCENLIVGVMTDEYIRKHKGRRPIMPFKDRCEIVSSIKYVHKVVPQHRFSFTNCTWLTAFKALQGNEFIIFDNERHSREMADVLIPYMKCVSSTLIRRRIYENFNHSKRTS